MTDSDFRRFLPDLDSPRLAEARGLDPRQYAGLVRADPVGNALLAGWAALYEKPFRGITNDGVVREGLYAREEVDPDHAAPVEEMVARADALIGILSDETAAALRYGLDAPQWRSWSNPEFIQHDTGVRLEELDDDAREAALALIEASLSPEGYRLTRDLMRVNDYLGRLVELPTIMNEYSYHFALYGTPALDAPWGWNLFGHHVVLNCLVYGTQLVISPVFFGAEPSSTEEEKPVLVDRAAAGLALLHALPDDLRRDAVVYATMHDPEMPEGRYHIADQRHLAGAFQDNRVIPYEGIPAERMPAAAQELLVDTARVFFDYLPSGPRAARVEEFRRHLDETWFCWIGGTDADSVFYFRVQSPVAILEFDHHSGVFLTNEEAEPFHIHTIVRTPNGNDYGRALIGRPL